MSKVKINITEEFPSRTVDSLIGTAGFDVDDLPDDLKLPSKARLAKKWRKWKAYERVWNAVCEAHERDEREAVLAELKGLEDPVDFIVYLLEFYSNPSNTSKAGGDAKCELSDALLEHARSTFEQKNDELSLGGRRYSQKQFAVWYRHRLAAQYEERMQEIEKLEAEIDRVTAIIKLGELTASQLKVQREIKRGLEEEARIKPILPAAKTIEGWLKAL